MGSTIKRAHINQKGGVGKTVTSVNTAVGLADEGKKVLLIDCEPQGNSTMHLGLNPDKLNHTIKDLFELVSMNSSDDSIKTCIDATMVHAYGVDLIPSNLSLSSYQEVMLSVTARERLLKRIVDIIETTSNYDYIIIDSPPALGTLTKNILTAVDEVFVIMEPHNFSATGLKDLIKTYNMVKNILNPKLSITGVIINMLDKRLNQHKESIIKIENGLPNKVFKSKIRRLNSISKAAEDQKPLFYNVDNDKYQDKGVADFKALVSEILEKDNQRRS